MSFELSSPSYQLSSPSYQLLAMLVVDAADRCPACRRETEIPMSGPERNGDPDVGTGEKRRFIRLRRMVLGFRRKGAKFTPWNA